MPIAHVNGTSLNCELEGSGPSLVLVHGALDEGATWQPVVPALAETFTVVTYDRRGFGKSGPVKTLPSVQAHVDDLAALIEELDLAPRPPGRGSTQHREAHVCDGPCPGLDRAAEVRVGDDGVADGE